MKRSHRLYNIISFYRSSLYFINLPSNGLGLSSISPDMTKLPAVELENIASQAAIEFGEFGGGVVGKGRQSVSWELEFRSKCGGDNC